MEEDISSYSYIAEVLENLLRLVDHAITRNDLCIRLRIGVVKCFLNLKNSTSGAHPSK